ncbi:type II toxin-antitoxin system RelE/ParE family toxin [Hyphobacterium sp. CCMP332]|nr:type II toxin-antitoxin system RelE/ParE family toxin [Hyphobacterium sp. CCMP332]
MKVYLSPLAEFKLDSIYDYLDREWSEKVKREFQKKLFASFKSIAQFPKSHQESQSHPGIFKCVLNKQNSYIYRIIKDEIEIITVFDNRQDPDKIQKEIDEYFA